MNYPLTTDYSLSKETCQKKWYFYRTRHQGLTELETSLNHLKNHTLEEDSEGMKLSLERVKLFKNTHSELSAWQRGLKDAIAVERRLKQKR